MKYIFVLGIGRGGTTLLGRLVSLSVSRLKYISEPFDGLRQKLTPECFENTAITPDNIDAIATARRHIREMGESNAGFLEDQLGRIQRADAQAEYLVLKEVHSLLAFPEILAGLDHKTVIITRDVTRLIDSQFYGRTRQERRYLIEEYGFARRYIKQPAQRKGGLLESAFTELPDNISRYLKRPLFLTSEILRYAVISTVINRFLTLFAERNDNVMHIRFEDLCESPIQTIKAVYDFTGLAHDETTLAEIRRITTGNDGSYYGTEKNSRLILRQPYKVLRDTDLNRINNLISENKQ